MARPRLQPRPGLFPTLNERAGNVSDDTTKPPIRPTAAEVEEAARLAERIAEMAQVLAQNLRFWGNPAEPPTCGITLDPSADPATLATDVQDSLARLREAAASLFHEPGATSDEHAVNEIGELVFGAAGIVTERAMSDPAAALDHLLGTIDVRLPGLASQLRAEPVRALLLEAVRSKLNPRRRQRTSRNAPLWAEPFFDALSHLALGGRSGDVDSWWRVHKRLHEKRRNSA